jgi:putative ABC transport system permease protein
MFKNGLLTTWRNIRNHKAYSSVKIIGLAIGMAGCLLIAFWVQDELSYDKFHANRDRIYRVVSDWAKYDWKGISGTPSPLADAVRSGLPEVERAARLSWQNRRVFRYKDKVFFENRGIVVDPSFFEIFSFPLVKGNWTAAFRGPEDIVVTETMAAKYFGSEDPMGKTIEVEGRPWVIRGVLKDIPRHSSIQFDYANSFQFIGSLSGYAQGWGAFNFGTFVQLKNGTDTAAAGQKITEIGDKNGSPQVKMGARFRLQSLSRVHLTPEANAPEGVVLGDASVVLLFSVIAVFVLIVACINFVNLTTARLGLRAKEVGLRKTLGAGRAEIARRFFGEAFLLVGVAAVIALGLVALLIPAFNRLSGKSLSLDLFRPGALITLAVVVSLTGLAAGLYPALSLSAFQPAKVLKGGPESGRKGAAFRKILVVFQFALSLALLITTVVVVRQFRFMRDADPGFVRDNIVQIPVKENAGKSFEAVKARLLQNPAVQSVSGQSYSFAETTWRSSGNFDWEGRDPDNKLDMAYTGVAYGYFETMGMKILAGRPFSPDHPSDAREGYILNETAVRKMGIANPVGKRFAMAKDRQGIIIGVVRDARFRTFHHEVDPCVFYVSDLAANSATALLMVRIDGSKTSAALAHLRRVWGEFNPMTPFEYRFLDDTYAALYGAERRMSSVFRVFAGLAMFIAVLGLLGLAAFMAERRTREIGIRKVLGASAPGIVVSMSAQLTRGVLAANLLAWPAAYLVANKLLRAYAYRVGLNIGFFVLPALAVFALAFLAVGLQSLRAANTDPVKALRYE